MSETDFTHYTNVADLWNEIGVRVRNPKTKLPEFYKVAYQPKTYTKTTPGFQTAGWRTLAGVPLRETVHKTMRDYRAYANSEAHGDLFGTISPVYQFIGENVQTPCGVDSDVLRTVFIDIEVESRNGFAAPENPTNAITAITAEVWGNYLVWGCRDYTPTQSNITYAKCEDEIEMLESFVKWWISDYPDIVTGWNVQFYDIPYILNRIDYLKARNELKFKSSIMSPWNKTSSRPVMLNGKNEFVVEIVGVSILDYLELYRKYSLTQQESYRLDYIAEVELGENKLSYEGSLQDLCDRDFQTFIEYNVKDVELVRKLNDKLHHIDLCIQLAYNSKVNFSDTFKQVRMWDAIIYYDLRDKQIAVPQNVKHDKLADYAGAYVKDPIVGKHSWIVSFDINSLYPSIMREWNISADKHIETEFILMRRRDLSHIVPQESNDFSPAQWRTGAAVEPRAVWALDKLIGLVTSATVDSMLPDLEQQDPYAFLRILSVTVTPNNQVYDSGEAGFLPRILATMYEDRKAAKNKEIAARKEYETTKSKKDKERLKKEYSKWGLEQNTKKIALNSAYGALGSAYFRFFDIRHAEAITLTGQLIIRHLADNINVFLASRFGKRDYVVASDTDSLLLSLDVVVKNNPADTNELIRVINEFCETSIQPLIDKLFREIHDKLNTVAPILAMKREVIAEHGVWTAKKRYILLMHDKEGVRFDPPKLKITGIEAVRSSTPKYAREIIKKALEYFVRSDQDGFYDLMDEAKEQFETKPFEEIASPRSVNGMTEYPILPDGTFTSKTPIQVKGALVYNRHLETTGLSNKYQSILNGQKIRFCYLRPQNPLRCNVIAAPDKLPKEWKLEKFLDRAEQFDKTIAQPLLNIIQYSGWSVERTTSLDF